MEPETLFMKSATMVAIGIFNKPSVVQKINKYLQDTQEEGWKQSEDIYAIGKSELDSYVLPDKTKDLLSRILYPISDQIVSQSMLYEELGGFHNKIMEDFFWESNGTINNLETCKRIFDRDLDDDIKIRLACIFCLEDKLNNLLLTKDGYWKRQMDDILLDDSHNHYNNIIRYWFEHLRKKVSQKDVISRVSVKDAISHSILQGNEVAVEYLFKKLTPEDKDFLIFQENLFPSEIVSKVHKNRTLFFLVKQYKVENLKDLCFTTESELLAKTILECFLSFPYRNNFLLYEPVLLPLITYENSFYDLLLEISNNLLMDPEVYEIIYFKLWSDYCSKYDHIDDLLFNDEKDEGLIKNLLNAEKYQFVMSIINHHDSNFEKACFFLKYFKTLASKLSFYGKEHIFKEIAVKCLLSKEDVIEFRDDWNNALYKKKFEWDENEDKVKDEDNRIEHLVQDTIKYLFELFDIKETE